jgi:hypothetical protein
MAKVQMTAVQIHLNLQSYKDSSNLIHESSLVAGLRTSRLITGRNIDIGAVDGTNTCGYLGSWNGAMGYITILDQIGKCYRPDSKPQNTTNASSIKKALEYFTTLSMAEINAIYALRNAFFHDFSLLNKDTRNYHRFKVDNHPTNSVVVLPTQSWDGNINNFTATNETYINLKTLGDLVESIYQQLLTLETTGHLILDLPGGDQELLARYIFYHY